MATPDQDAPPPVSPPAAGRRLFFAVPVEETIRERLADASRRLQIAAKMTPLVATWVPPRNFHLTLHFLGAVEHAAADRLIVLCQRAKGLQWESEKLTARSVGYFPHDKAPSVMWTAIKAPSPAIDGWRHAVGRLVTDAGIAVPAAEFHAHITLARFKGLRGTGLFVKMAGQFERTTFGAWWAREIHLLESRQGGPAPVYETVATIALTPRPDQVASDKDAD